jgi:hypothetical protein
MARTDIQLLDNDLVIQNNDLVIGESDDQHIEDTINSGPGWWKENYTDGVNIRQYLKSKNFQEINRAITLNLQSDGYVASPIISNNNGQLTINPNAISSY